MNKPYPSWVCSPCGTKHGNHPVGLATWHQDACDICGKDCAVCESRDFGHLKDGWQNEAALTLSHQRGFALTSPTMLLFAIVTALAMSNAAFVYLYRSAVDDLSSFKSTVEKEGELLRIENERKLQEVAEVNRQVNDDYAKARAALAGRPRVVRVRESCSGTGILPTVSSNAGITANLPVEEPRFSAEHVITVEECETRLGYAIEDAVTIEWMKDWAAQVYEASK